jgi:hypothetical protein
LIGHQNSQVAQRGGLFQVNVGQLLAIDVTRENVALLRLKARFANR